MKHLIGYLGLALCAALLAGPPRAAVAADADGPAQIVRADAGGDAANDDAVQDRTRDAPAGSLCTPLGVAANMNPFAGGGANGCTNPYLRNAAGSDGPYHTWSGYRAP